MADAGELRHLPLEDMHVKAGARFGGFAGWSMPLTYPPGVMKEHLHTREKAGLFDISHMKLFLVEGSQAADMLARMCPLDPSTLDIGQSKYTFFLTDKAGIIDDLIVTRLGQARFMIVANAGNADVDEAHLLDVGRSFDATVTPLDRVFLALQGPAAAGIAASAGLDVSGLTFMHGKEPKEGWFMTRSGYTGEDGFEIAVPPTDAEALAEALLANGEAMWIGLAARDSLRLEAGLCLHGQDITREISPLHAGLMWAISKPVRETGRFFGAKSLARLLDEGPTARRVGLKPEGRQPVRGGAALFDADGNPAGQVTSGGFGPSADGPVAMGYVPAALASPGQKLFADVRGNRLPVAVHSLPFAPHRYFKG
jgi:aminomethyltransferase